MKHKLIKLSEPGFELESDKLQPIIDLLLMVYCCETCVDYDLPEGFDGMNEWDQLDELLMTPCGAEFIFEEVH